MQTVVLKPGDFLYREGDPSDSVYFIESGMVEVHRSSDDESVVLAELGTGQILGEMGVVLDEPRSTTVRASSETTLMALDAEQFRSAFGTNGNWGMRVLRMLCERLASANEQVAKSATDQGAAPIDRIRAMILLPDSPAMERQIGQAGLEISSLPYTVGRRMISGYRTKSATADLILSASDGSQMSQVHFIIEADQSNRLHIRDLDSNLGTFVNGTRLSRFERFESDPVAPLHFGENEIVAGGLHSPFRFRLAVRPLEKNAPATDKASRKVAVDA